MQYQGEICPICQKAFIEDDDIVVCPVCGTPHHRKCYFEQKDCAYAARHAEGFAWQPQNAQSESKENAKPKVDSNGHRIVFCPSCGAENPAEEPNCQKCGERLYNNPNGVNAPQLRLPDRTNQPYSAGSYVISPHEMLGENTVGDTAEYIQKGTSKYIPKFFAMEKGKKKVSFNWAALFFGPHWFFYRRMYAMGATILLALILIFAGALTPRFLEKSQDVNILMESVMEGASAAEQESYIQKATELLALPEVQGRFILTALTYLLCGLFGNYYYKKQTEKQVQKIREKSENEQKYRLTLFRSGGTSMAMALASFLILNAATNIIAMLVQL